MELHEHFVGPEAGRMANMRTRIVGIRSLAGAKAVLQEALCRVFERTTKILMAPERRIHSTRKEKR
jgi:hypothetical protein